MISIIIASYFILFVCTPILVKQLTRVDPYGFTRGYINIQSFNDFVHVVCALTPMVLTGNAKMVPLSVLVYFSLDIGFNYKTFIINQNYFLHHLFACFQILLVYKYFIKNIETLAYFIWVQETALIPILTIDIFRMQFMKIPKSLYVLRALWYFSSRLYTYFFFFYNYDAIFLGFPKYKMLLLCTPLILHNANVFKLQILSMIRIL